MIINNTKAPLEDMALRLVGKTRQIAGLVSSLTFQSYSRYEVVRGTWKGVSVPSLTYASDVLCFKSRVLQQLDLQERRVGRVALGTKKYTAREPIQGEMGWSSFEVQFRANNLKYLGRIWTMEKTNPVQCVYEFVAGWERTLCTTWFREAHRLKEEFLPDARRSPEFLQKWDRLVDEQVRR